MGDMLRSRVTKYNKVILDIDSGIDKIENYKDNKELILLWLEWVEGYKLTRLNIKDVFSKNILNDIEVMSFYLDKVFVLSEQNYNEFGHSVKSNINCIVKIINKNFSLLNKSLEMINKNDVISIVNKILSKNPYLYRRIDKKYKENDEITLNVLKIAPEVYIYTPKKYRGDELLALEVLKKAVVLNSVNRKTRNLFGVFSEALKNNGNQIECLKPKYKNNKSICLSAINENVSAYKYLSKKQKEDIDIIIRVLEKEPSYIGHMPNRIRNKFKDDPFNVMKNLENFKNEINAIKKVKLLKNSLNKKEEIKKLKI